MHGGQPCTCDPPESAGISIAKQLLTEQLFQEDMHGMILQATADIATGLRSSKWPGTRAPILYVQSIEASLYHLSLGFTVIGIASRKIIESLRVQANLCYSLKSNHKCHEQHIIG